MTFVEMLAAGWIAGWIANSSVLTVKENIIPQWHDDYNLQTFCFGNFCIMISNPGFK